jgi:glycosyltransferase involved in cell wall biosynthesis
MKLSVIIPVFNEQKTIKQIIDKVKAQKEVNQIIVVDDGSSDGTRQILKKLSLGPKLKIIFHSKNQGKGTAVRTGLKYIKGDYVIIQDADLEYDPAEYSRLIKPIKDNKAEVVFGSRFTGEHRNMFFWHMFANKLLTLITNILFDTTLSDMETCYKLIPTKVLCQLDLKSRNFDFEPEITAKILKKRVRIYEVPISYAGREYSQGKKIRWYDGIWAFVTLIRYRFLD